MQVSIFEVIIIIVVALIKSLHIVNPSRNSPSKVSSSKVTKEKDFSKSQVLRSFYTEMIFVKDCTPYDNICDGLLKEFFIEKSDLVYPMPVQIFYANLKHEGVSITSRIGETKINFTTQEFEVMSKTPYYGKT